MGKIKAALLAVWGFITAAAVAFISILISKNKVTEAENKQLKQTVEDMEKNQEVQKKFDEIQRAEDEKKQEILDSIDSGKPISDVMSDLRKNSRNRAGINNK